MSWIGWRVGIAVLLDGDVTLGVMVIVYVWDVAVGVGVTAGAVAMVDAPPQPANVSPQVARIAAMTMFAEHENANE